MIDPHFVLVGAALSIIGSISYAILTWRGLVRPNRVSWFLWAAAPLIGFAAQLDSGVGVAAVSTLAIGVGPMIILAASFANTASYWNLTRFDISCGVVSAAALVLWLSFDDPVLAVLTALLADLIGGIPTIVKAWREPGTERSVVYIFCAMNGIIALLALQQWSAAHYAFPVYLVFLGLGLTAIVQVRGRMTAKPDELVPHTETAGRTT